MKTSNANPMADLFFDHPADNGVRFVVWIKCPDLGWYPSHIRYHDKANAEAESQKLRDMGAGKVEVRKTKTK